MAEIVMGLATANTPLLVLEPSQWAARAAADRNNKNLIDIDGERRTYDELAQRNGDRYAKFATPEHFQEQHEASRKALDRLAGELAQAKADVVVLLSHDAHNVFSEENQPVLCVYFGEKMIGGKAKLAPDAPEWQRVVAKGQGQDEHHEFAVASEFSRELIVKMMAEKVDTASANEIPDPAAHGFGYTYTFPVVRLMGEGKYPLVPILLNALFPPNQPTPRRCYEMGRALGRAIKATAPGTRVALVTSLGMSHFVTNEELDRKVLKAIEANDADALRQIPVKLIGGSNGQIRDLIMAAGVMEGRRVNWSEYIPVYRTAAGTGIGIAFVSWA